MFESESVHVRCIIHIADVHHFSHSQLATQPSVPRTRSYYHAKLALGLPPPTALLVPHTQRIARERDDDRLLLARLEVHAREPAEDLGRLALGGREADVDLSNLRTRNGADVLEIELDRVRRGM